MPSQNPPRAYSGAHFNLELDHDKEVGLFRSIEGGGVKVDVLSYQAGNSFEAIKQLGKPKFEDFKIQVGMSMSSVFYEWIAEFFRGGCTRKNGAVVAADFYYNERARREFTNAIITELAFPKLDASDKNAAYMNVTICPEEIKFVKGSGQKLQFTEANAAQKLWAACNFAMLLDPKPLERSLLRCTKIEGFTLKQKPIEYHHGFQRWASKIPGRIEYPNLSFTIPEADAQPLFEHMAKHGVGGAPMPIDEINGSISTYDNANKPLFHLHFFGGRLLNATVDKSDAGSEEFKQVKFEMAIEKMDFAYEKYEFMKLMEDE